MVSRVMMDGIMCAGWMSVQEKPCVQVLCTVCKLVTNISGVSAREFFFGVKCEVCCVL